MNAHAKLLTIGHVGMKAHDATYDLANLTILSGANGAGKSTVLEAISLLINGWVLGVDKTYDGVLTLARGERLRVFGTVRLPDGRTARIARTWTRSLKRKKGTDTVVIAQDIDCSCFSGSDADKDGFIKGIFGAMPEAWNPAEFLDLTPAKMRDRLLRLIPASEIGSQKLVPEGCPEWAKDEFDALQPHEWVQQAIRRAKDKISKAQASSRETNVELDNVGDAHAGDKDLEPLRGMLVMLRRELLNSNQRALTEAALVKIQRQVTDARAKASEALPKSLIYFVSGMVDAAALAIQQQIANDKHARATFTARLKHSEECQTGLLADCANLRKAIDAFGDIPAATGDDLVGLEHQFAELEADEQRLLGVISAIQSEVARHKNPALHTCPACAFDLAAFHADEQQARARDLETQRADLALIEIAIGEVDAQLSRTRRGMEKRVEIQRLKDLEGDLAAIGDSIRELKAEAPAARTFPDVTDVQAEIDALVDEALERANALGAIEALEARARELLAELEGLPEARPPAEIEAEIKKLDRSIEEAVRWNERVARLRDAEEQRLLIEEQLAELQRWLGVFTRIQAKLVEKTKAWYESRLSEVCGAAVTVELVNARGHDDCRFAVDGVYAETLNVGHRLTFVVALFVVLASASSAPWRPILVDQFEHISRDFREGFMRAISSAVDSGAVSQAVLAGCADEIPEIEGAKHYELSRDRTAVAEAPAPSPVPMLVDRRDSHREVVR